MTHSSDIDPADDSAADPTGHAASVPANGPATAEDALGGVRREVVLDAPAEQVWDQLASADGLRGWLADEVDVEVRPGATGTVRDGDGPARPVLVEEVDPERRLTFVWGDEPGTVVDIAVEPAREEGPDRTRVVVVEVPVRTLRLVGTAAERIVAGAPGGGTGPVASAAGSPTPALALAGRT